MFGMLMGGAKETAAKGGSNTGLLGNMVKNTLQAEWYVGPQAALPDGNWQEVAAGVGAAASSMQAAGVVLENCRVKR